MIANFFKSLGGTNALLEVIAVLVVLMYITYKRAIGAIVCKLVYLSFTTLEVFRTTK